MTVIPDKYNFTIWQGASFYEQLFLYSDSGVSTARDITGYTAEMVIRDKPKGSVYMTLSTSNGGIVISGPTGSLQLKISATATDALAWKVGAYDLTIKSPSDVTDALLYGNIKVIGV